MDKYLKNNSTPGNDRSSAEQTDGALSPFLSADEPIVSELADDPDLCEVAQMFIDELPETMKKIQESFQQKDLKALKFLLHSLKGSSGSAGFPVLMAKAADMESQALQEELENLQNELDEMNALFSRAISRSPS